MMLKLGILAKEGISIDALREDPPDKVTFAREPIYENNVENSTTQRERGRKIRNEQLKNAWPNRCQKIELAGIFDLGSHEESIIRDVFIANLQNGEIQRELLKKRERLKRH